MKLSRYLKIYPSDRFQDRLLLFSTRKASKVIITRETLKEIEEERLSEEETNLLKELKIIVDDHDSEKDTMLRHFDTSNAKNKALDIILSMNFDCNFACLYCFENDVKCNSYMTDATENRLICFLEKELKDGRDSLNICYYGGEPLLSLKRVKSISSRLKAMTEEMGIKYTGSMISNGSLLTAQTATELLNVGIQSVKVTLDGPPEIHNKYRPFKSGAGSFETVLKNIIDCCDILNIELGGNYDQNSYTHFAELLDILQERGLSSDKLPMVNFGPVIKKPECEPSYSDYNGGLTVTSETWVMEAETFIRREIIRRGYKTSKLRPMGCTVNFTKAFVIDHSGLIYKCQNFIGKKGFEIGDIASGIRDYTQTYLPDHWKNSICPDCEYLPLCFGGCRYVSYANHGELKTLDCQKEYLDNALEALVKEDLDPEVF